MFEEENDEITKKYKDELLGWHAEVHVHLNNFKRIPNRCEFGMIHIVDEIAYWEERLFDLEFTSAILKRARLTEIVNYLRRAESCIVEVYYNMTDKVEIALTEAKSNLKYLQIVKDPCINMYDVESLRDIIPMLPNLFLHFIFIFEESLYYNETYNFDHLCECLFNQVIFLCRETIDTASILDSDVKMLMDSLRRCLLCCQHCITVYNEVIKKYNNQFKEIVLWEKAYMPMYKFIERCQNLKYILKSKIVFKRLNVYHMDVPKPNFSFAPGKYFVRMLDETEQQFDADINKLKVPLKGIFNVLDDVWDYHNNKFKIKVEKLSIEIQRITDMALKTACNEIDCIQILQSLRYFFECPSLKSYFRLKTKLVYTFLIDYIASVNKNEYWIPHYMPKYSGMCMMAITQYNKITILKNAIFDRPWLLENSLAKQLREAYSSYADLHQQRLNTSFGAWWDQIDPKIENQLNNHIFIKKQLSNRCWNFTLCLKSHIYDLTNEIVCWNLIKVGMPYKHSEFTKIAKKIRILHKNVTVILKDYNYIIAGLSKQEIQMFYEQINTCVTTIDPLVNKYTWSQSDNVNKYLPKCYQQLESVQNIENCFKQCNTEIVKICAQISKTPLFGNEIELTKISGLNHKMKNISYRNSVLKIIGYYNEIIRYVTVVYEIIEKKIERIMLFWKHYLIKIDTLVQKSLVVNVRLSMKKILAQRTETLFLINVSLHGNEIKYYPSLLKLVVYTMNIHMDIAIALKVIPRLCDTFKITNFYLTPYSCAIAHDQVCSDLQTEINITTKDLLIQINNYMNTFTQYTDIWTKDKQYHFNEFESNPHNADSIDKEIMLYLNYMSKLNVMKTEKTISFTIVKTNDMIKQIIRHCQNWILNYSILLLDETTTLIEGFYDYIKMNSERVMLAPANLDEMVEFIEYKKKVDLECIAKKEDINLITENVLIIDKHKIEMSDKLRSLYNNLHNSWNNYTILLNEAEVMLREKQEEFYVHD